MPVSEELTESVGGCGADVTGSEREEAKRGQDKRGRNRRGWNRELFGRDQGVYKAGHVGLAPAKKDCDAIRSEPVETGLGVTKWFKSLETLRCGCAILDSGLCEQEGSLLMAGPRDGSEWRRVVPSR